MSRLKIAGARRQLGTALSLYLQNYDPVSVHCLAGGGCEVIEYFAKKSGAAPFMTHILKTNPDMTIKEVRRLQRQYWTAFKHATHHSGEEREDDELLLRFSDRQNDDALFVGWHDYAAAVKAMPIEAQVHQAWYLALHPEKSVDGHAPQSYEDLFPKLREKSRAGQKRALIEVIANLRNNPDVMNHRATEQLALVLGWPQ